MQPVAVNDTLGQDPHFFGDAAKKFAVIGGQFNNPNIEDIAKARPDLIIGLANAHEQLRDALRPIAPLYIMNPIRYTDSIAYLKDIGRLTGRTAQADAAAQVFLNKLAAYESKSPKTKSAVLLYGSDVNFNVFTTSSLPGSLLSEVTPYAWPIPGKGGAPSSDHEPGATAGSLEELLARNPDAIFIASFTFAPGAQPISTQLAHNPVWSHLSAVQHHQVFEVRPDLYIFGRGTISLGLMLDDAMTKLYPDVFPQPLT
jgi:iron complex transport system substrate-binding protein